MDDSYFDGRRKTQQNIGTVVNKYFRLLKCDGKVYIKVIPHAKSHTLLPIIKSNIYLNRIVYIDNFPSCDVLDVSHAKP